MQIETVCKCREVEFSTKILTLRISPAVPPYEYTRDMRATRLDGNRFMTVT